MNSDYANPKDVLTRLAYDVYIRYQNLFPEEATDITGAGVLTPESVAALANQSMDDIEQEANWEYTRERINIGKITHGIDFLDIPESAIDSTYNLDFSPSSFIEMELSDGTKEFRKIVSAQVIHEMPDAVSVIGNRTVQFAMPLSDKYDDAEVYVYGFRKFTRLDSKTPDVKIDVKPYSLLVWGIAKQAVSVNPAWGFRYSIVLAEYNNMLSNAKRKNTVGGTTVVAWQSEVGRVI